MPTPYAPPKLDTSPQKDTTRRPSPWTGYVSPPDPVRPTVEITSPTRTRSGAASHPWRWGVRRWT